MLRYLLILIPFFLKGQSPGADCAGAIPILTLPYTSSWCTPDSSTTQLSNSLGMLHPQYGCWHCITNARWFTITTGDYGDVITINLDFNLTNPLAPNEPHIHGYYALFNNCPNDGGEILSYPCNCFNSSGECWEFGIEMQSSCFWDSPYNWPYDLYCQNGEPNWNFPSDVYSVTWYFEPNTTYYLAVFPSGGCNVPVTYGCITLNIDGPLLLQVQPPCNVWMDNNEIHADQYLERSNDLQHWHEVQIPDTPGPGIWYYRSCGKLYAFQIPEEKKYMMFDFLGRRIR